MRRARELPSALARADEIRRFLAGRPLAVFLDYDGTLAAIVREPRLAMLDDATRRALARLASRCPVAVVSGRDLDDVAARVSVPGVAYAGSHGFEIATPDGQELELPDDYLALEALDEVEKGLRREVEGVEGVLVERKRFAVALHYRGVPVAQVPHVFQAIERASAGMHDLERMDGRKVVELRPDVDWDKGRAVEWLLRLLDVDGVTPIYLGDDVTDEDAFEAVNAAGGTSVVVGCPERLTAARYRLEDVGEVEQFLVLLAEHCEQTGSSVSRRP